MRIGDTSATLETDEDGGELPSLIGGACCGRACADDDEEDDGRAVCGPGAGLNMCGVAPNFWRLVSGRASESPGFWLEVLVVLLPGGCPPRRVGCSPIGVSLPRTVERSVPLTKMV